MNKKSQNRNVIVVVSIIALIVVLGIVSLLYVRAEQEKNHLSAQLELGNRYMSELNYEQAIATYEAIIKIDPRCVDAYIAIAEAYVAMGDIETAEAILKQGYSLVNDEKIGEQLNKLQDTKGHNELEQTSEEKVVSTAEQRDDRFKARIVDGIYQREYYYYNLDKEDELAIENIISLGMEERIDEIHSVCVDGKLREILNNYSRNSGIQQIFIAFRDIKVSFYYSDQYDSEHFRISAIPLEEGKGFVYEVARTGEGDSLWMRTDYVLGECKEGMFNGEFKQETEVFTTGFFISEVLAGNAVNGLRTGEVTRSSTTQSPAMKMENLWYLSFMSMREVSLLILAIL